MHLAKEDYAAASALEQNSCRASAAGQLAPFVSPPSTLHARLSEEYRAGAAALAAALADQLDQIDAELKRGQALVPQDEASWAAAVSAIRAPFEL